MDFNGHEEAKEDFPVILIRVDFARIRSPTAFTRSATTDSPIQWKSAN